MGESDVRLRVIKGFEKGKTFPLTEAEITIGRAEENDLSIPVLEVSRRHAVLTQQEGGYLLRDLGSTNGTFVDRKRVGGKYLLKPGDTIMLGDAVYLVYEKEREEVDPMEVTPPSPMEVPEPPPPPPTPPAEAEGLEGEKAAPAAVADVDQEMAAMMEEGVEEERGGRRTWLWAGFGCLAVVLFIGVVGFVAFDYLNLYCTPPFDSLFDFIYTCPP